jgi:hypothetical protein
MGYCNTGEAIIITGWPPLLKIERQPIDYAGIFGD